MRTPRTFHERTTQLGRIAFLELELTKRNNPRTWRNVTLPRTNAAKRILLQYVINVFGRILTAEETCLNGEFKTIWEKNRYNTAQFQGIE